MALKISVQRYVLLFAAVFVLSAVPALAQAVTTMAGSGTVPIERLLGQDGSLKIPDGFSGSLALDGWDMTSAPDGSPRFVRSKKGRAATAFAPAAGDEYWDDRFGASGVNGVVRAIAVQGTDVFIGGQFTIAGGVLANNIARWNTATNQWSVLGSPANNGVSGIINFGGVYVNAMVLSGDDLYVGGIFETAGDIRALGVARYNLLSNTWHALGQGIMNFYSYAEVIERGGEVYAMAVDGADLYVGGIFSWINGARNRSTLVKWNGITWTSILPMVGGDTVRALGASGGTVYAGFTQNANCFRKYNGSAWTNVGNVNGAVFAITATSGGYYVGGSFTQAGGKTLANLAYFKTSDESFQAIGVVAGTNGPVFSIATSGANIYIGGTFSYLGDLQANAIARWNGSAWSSLGVGVGDTTLPVLSAIGVAPNGVYAGGRFGVAGTNTSRSIARWDGVQWVPMVKRFVSSANHNGTDKAIYAAAVNGPYIYIGGDFTTVGGQDANYVARWDTRSSQWEALGSGIGGAAPFIRSLVVDGDNVYFGGFFESAGGVQTNGIARWNQATNTWSAVAGGMGGPNPYVFSIVLSGTDLYVAGAFTSAGGVGANRIARYSITGGVWSALGAGLEGNDVGTYAFATCVAVVGTDVYVGGAFTQAGGSPVNRVARWNGSSWSGLSSGVNAQVSALATDGVSLYVGGDFTVAGGGQIKYMARWDGTSWFAVGTGPDKAVRCIVVKSATEIYTGGDYVTMGGIAASHVSWWDGAKWNSFTAGTNGAVRAIVKNGSDYYVCGNFTTAGGLRANNIALFDSRNWTALGSDPYTGISGVVYAMALRSGNVYVGGAFPSVGGVRTGGVAMWNGSGWSRLGSGLDGVVRAMTFGPDNNLYVGGDFQNAGTVPASGIARWDGSVWTPVGAGVGGAQPSVWAMAVSGQNLYVGGTFTTAGGIPANHIAVYNTAASAWAGMGGGLGGSSFITFVKAIAVSGVNVYIGGSFPTAGTVQANNIARWDGINWNALGDGTDNTIHTLAFDRTGGLIAGGDFGTAGTVRTQGIARWNGSAWAAMGAGLNGSVYCLGFSPQGLFAGGDFIASGNTELHGVSYWNGYAWTSLGSGVAGDHNSGIVLAMAATSDSGLYVGGDFAVAGSKPSFYFGRWYNPVLDVPMQPREALPLHTLTARVYPNPVGGPVATVAWQNPEGVQSALCLADATGRHIRRWTQTGQFSTFSTAGLDPGTYFLTVQCGQGKALQKIQIIK